jgi:hypothetical protein
MKERKIKIGKVYEVKTPAGPKIHVKAIRTDPKEPYGFFATIERHQDLVALSRACVPWDPKTDKPGESECFVFHHNVIKEVRGPYKKHTKKLRKSTSSSNTYTVITRRRRGKSKKENNS